MRGRLSGRDGEACRSTCRAHRSAWMISGCGGERRIERVSSRPAVSWSEREFVIDAQSKNVLLERDAAGHGATRGRAGFAAGVDVEILDLAGPVLQESPFDAGAGYPASGRRCDVGKRTPGANRAINDGDAARPIKQDAIDRVTDPSAT